CERIQPSTLRQFSPELSPQEILLVVLVRIARPLLELLRHVRLEPGPNLASEPLLLFGICDLKVHRSASKPQPAAVSPISGPTAKRSKVIQSCSSSQLGAIPCSAIHSTIIWVYFPRPSPV